MKKALLGLVCLAITVIACISCKIGLGQAVDTQAPELSITKPGVGAIIRDKFAIGGVWSDDGSIKDPANGGLTIVLERTDNSGSPITYTGSLDNDSGTWSCVIDPKAEGNPVLDGEYQATVTIVDTYEHKTVKSITFTVDNTAPVVVLQRPSSKETASDNEIDLYGQKLTLTGQAADDNNISSIKIYFYSDPACTQYLHDVELKNVPPTIELDVAKFIAGENNDYAKIYQHTEKGYKEKVYCRIEAYDNAQRYPSDGSNQEASDTKGNCTTTYYLYEEIATDVLSDYKITDVYHMFSGNYSNGDANRAATGNSIKEILKNKKVTTGSMFLDPKNNPKFIVSGKSSLPAINDAKYGHAFDSNESEYQVLNNSQIIIEVSAGLDAIPLVADSLKVYFLPCDENGIATVQDVAANRIYPSVSTWTKSGSSYKFTTTVNADDGMELRTADIGSITGRYIIKVEGEDEKHNDIIAEGNGYGFLLMPSSTAPVVKSQTIKAKKTSNSTEYNMDYVKKSAEGYFKATITFNSDLGPFTFTKNDSPINLTWDSDDNSGWVIEDEITLPANSGDRNFKYKIIDSEGGYAEASVTAKTDNEAPVVYVDALPGNTDTLNSSFTFMGTVEDALSGVEEVWLTITDAENHTHSKKVTGISAWSCKVDFVSEDSEWKDVFASQGVKTVKIKAIDKVGNEKTTFKLTENKDDSNVNPAASMTFVYDKDRPTLTVDQTSIRTYMPKGGFEITGTAGDSYAFEKIKIKETKTGTDAGTTSKEITALNDDGTWTCFVPLNKDSSFVPTSGSYKYEIIAYDTVGNEVSTSTNSIIVDTTAPTVGITDPADNTARKGKKSVNEVNFSFKGSVLDESEVSGVYYKILPASDTSTPAVPSSGNLALAATWENAGWTATNSGTTSWTAVQSFVSGTNSSAGFCEALNYKIYVYAVDAAGNYNEEPVIRTFDVDFKEPTVVTKVDGTSVETNTTATKTAAYTFKFSATDTFGLDGTTPISVVVKKNDSEITRGADYFVKSGTTTVAPTTKLVAGTEYEIVLAGEINDINGLYTYEVVAKDKAGKETKAERNIRLDTKAPAISVLSPDLGAYQNDTDVTVRGSTEDESGTKLVLYSFDQTSHPELPTTNITESGSWTAKGWSVANGTTTWDFDVTGVEGQLKNLYLVAVDSNGLVSEVQSKTLKVDKNEPTMVSEGTAVVTNNTFTLNGDVYDANGIASVEIKWTKGEDTDTFSTGSTTKPVTVTAASGNSGTTTTEKLANAKASGSKASFSKSFTITSGRTGGAKDNELSDGKYKFKITVKDAAGKISYVERDVTIDTQNPTVSFTTALDASANVADANKTWISGTTGNTYFSGEAGDSGLSNLEGIYVSIDGATPSKIPAGESWTFEKRLSELTENTNAATSVHSIAVYSKDNAGNVSPTETKYFRYDKAEPTITLVQSGEYVNGNTGSKVTLSGTTTDGTGRPVTVKLTTEKWNGTNGVYASNTYTSTLTNKNGAYSFDITKAALTNDGKYRFTVTATDYAGKTAVAQKEVIIDTAKPTVSFADELGLGTAASASAKLIQGTGSTYFTGTASDSGESGLDNIYISFDGGSAVLLGANTNWSYEKTLNGVSEYIPGTASTIHKLEIYAKDKAGNQSETTTGFFRYDKAAPVLELGEVSQYINNTSGITITGTANDGSSRPVSVILTTKKWDATENDYVTYTGSHTETLTNKTGSFSFNVAKTNFAADGKYQFTVTAKDYVDRETTANAIVYVDTAAPTGSVTLAETAPYVNDEEKWYKSQQVKIKVTCSDATSGIETVEAKAIENGATDSEPTANLTTLTRKVEGTTVWYEGNIETVVEGANEIKVRVTDKAGNVNTSLSTLAYRDSEAPDSGEFTLISIDGITNTVKKSINATPSDVVVVMTLKDKDDLTPIKNVTVNKTGAVSSAATALTGTDAGKWQLTIKKEDLPENSGSLALKVEDSVGNYTIYSPVTFEVDKQAPTISIALLPDADTNTTDVYDINGKVNISITATDDIGLPANTTTGGVSYSPAILKYVVDASATKNITWSTVTNTIPVVVNSDKSLSATFDTTTTSYDGKYLYLYLECTDQAGNTATFVNKDENNNLIVYKIDQSTDRPVIRFTNISRENNQLVLKLGTNSIIEGTISDDDSLSTKILKNVYMSSSPLVFKSDKSLDTTKLKGTLSSWNPVTGNFKFTPEVTSDGTKTIYFYVEDNEGTKFASSTPTGASYGKPFLLYKDEAKENNLGASVTYLSDANNPDIGNTYVTIGTRPANNTADEYEVTDTTLHFRKLSSSSCEIGGVTKNKVKLEFNATDDNGIKSIVAVVKKGSTTIGTYDSTATGAVTSTSSDGKTLTFTTGEIDFTGKGSGTVDISLAVTDKSGLYSTGSSSFKLDFDAPDFEVTSHDENQVIYGSQTNTLKGTVTGNDVNKVYYSISTTNCETGTASTTKTAYEALTWTQVPNHSSYATVNIKFDMSKSDDEVNTAAKLATYNEAHTDSAHAWLLRDYMTATKVANDINETLYVNVKLVDDKGNIGYENHPLSIIPNGDKPTVEILYPTDASVLSDLVRVSGTSSTLTQAVKDVYLQLDILSGDVEPSISTTWYNKNAIKNNYTIVDVYDDGNNFLFKGIKVSGQNNWNLPINTRGELYGTDAQGKSTASYIAINVISLSTTYKQSDSQLIKIKFDPKAPKIGQTIPLQMVQFDSANAASDFVFANAKRNRLYNQDAGAENWIKCLNSEGKAQTSTTAAADKAKIWYLMTSIEDDEGVKELSIKCNNDDTIYLVKADETDTTETTGKVTTNTEYVKWVTEKTNTKGKKVYDICIPIKTTGTVGEVSYEITAVKGTNQNLTARTVISMNYDNEAPQLDSTIEGKVISIPKNVQQTNGAYTMQSTITDAFAGATPSGIKGVAFYFKRGNKIYDPRDNRTAVTTSDSAKDMGLYWKNYAITTTTSATDEVTLTAADSTVRAGNWVKVNGSIYLIKEKSGSTITLDADIPSGISSIDVALASIIDNFSPESGDDLDGDGVIEGLTGNQITAGWYSDINSGKIPDGPIEIHYVGFDKALNFVEKSITDAYVSNNAPRIAGVAVATKYDGTNEIKTYKWVTEKTIYTADGSVTKSSAVKGNGEEFIASGNGKTAASGTDAATALMTVKGSFDVYAEMVGGNGDLYLLNDKSATYTAGKKTGNKPAAKWQTGTVDNDSIKDDNGQITSREYKLETVNTWTTAPMNTNGLKWLRYTIWDSTEGTTVGTNSQNVTANILIDLQAHDDVKPNVFIRPLYWNNATNNSIYTDDNGRQGHIELKAKLTNALKAAPYGTGDKVSGTVVFRGYAWDNIKLQKLEWAIVGSDGNSILPVKESGITYNAGSTLTGTTWSTTGSLATDGYTFKVISAVNETEPVLRPEGDRNINATDVYINKDGHKVVWELTVDTSKIAGTVAKDAKLYVRATDAKSVTNTTRTTDMTSTGTAAATVTAQEAIDKANKQPTYLMDIVPYITKVTTAMNTSLKTSIRDAYARTTLGHYVVNDSETVIFEGFNIKGADAAYVSAKGTGTTEDTTVDLTGTNKNELNMSNVSTSSEILLKVGTLYSINNMNNNDVTMKTGLTLSNTTKYDDLNNYAYNRMPNNKGNNLLTDDIYFDVWQFDADAAEPVSGELREPVVKVNPVTGKLGFAFVSGPADFAMADGHSTHANDITYKTYQHNYATFMNVSMTYDELGYSYGTVTGLDTYPDGATSTLAGRFTLQTSRWGNSQTGSMDDNYYGTRKIRMEAIGLPGQATQGVRIKGEIKNTYTMTETRFFSPSIAAVNHTSGTSVYLAYYDSVQGQIRFRAGNNIPTPNDISTENNVQNATVNKNFGDFQDNVGMGDLGNFKHVYESKTNAFSLIAGADWQKVKTAQDTTNGYTNKVGTNYFYDTGYKAAKYVAIDARKDASTISVYTNPTNLNGKTLQGGTFIGGSRVQGNTGRFQYTGTDYAPFVNKNVYTLDSNKKYIGTASITTQGHSGSGYDYLSINNVQGNGTIAYIALQEDAVFSGGTSTDVATDVVVAVWFDGNNCCYAYNDNPTSGLDNGVEGGWKGNKVIFSDGGEHCTVKFGPDGSVHIAANVDGNLKYAYLSSYSAAYSEATDAVTVDSYAITGEKITLDVGNKAFTSGTTTSYKVVPYISYYLNSAKKPAVASLVIPSSGTMNYKAKGVDENSNFTGNWDVSIVPSPDTLTDYYLDKINVVLWKKDTTNVKGVITTPTDEVFDSASYNTFGRTDNGGNHYASGNDTQNPLLGYAIVTNSGTALEVAQKK